VDYAEEAFDDEDYDDDQSNDDIDSDNDHDKQDDMDENELADIMDEPHGHNVLNEQNQRVVFANEEEEIVFEEQEENADNDAAEENPDDDDEDYEEQVKEDDESLIVDEEEDTPTLRRTDRVRVPNPRYQHLQAQDRQTEEYSIDSAHVLALTMSHFNDKMAGMNEIEAFNFLQTYSLNQGIKKFGERGTHAAHKEMKQLHERVVFEPIKISDMTQLERKRAMESLIFLTEKQDGTVKARTCANGSTQRAYIPREEATSPTASTESILMTAVIDAKQERDVMTLDVPNAFVQTPIPQSGDKIIMKIRGRLVDILLEISPGVYDEHVTKEGKQKVLHVRMLKALYGMLIASIL
jgi:hypothetical protein